MNFRDFDNAVYQKCGHLSMEEQAATGYKRRADMENSFIKMYSDPKYQREIGSGQYKIKNPKQLPIVFRGSKKKVNSRVLEDEGADTRRREELAKKLKADDYKLSTFQKTYKERVEENLASVFFTTQMDYDALRFQTFLRKTGSYMGADPQFKADIRQMYINLEGPKGGVSLEVFDRLTNEQQLFALMSLPGFERTDERDELMKAILMGRDPETLTSVSDLSIPESIQVEEFEEEEEEEDPAFITGVTRRVNIIEQEVDEERNRRQGVREVEPERPRRQGVVEILQEETDFLPE